MRVPREFGSICTPRYLVSVDSGISVPLTLRLFLGILRALSVDLVNCMQTVFVGLNVSPIVPPQATNWSTIRCIRLFA